MPSSGGDEDTAETSQPPGVQAETSLPVPSSPAVSVPPAVGGSVESGSLAAPLEEGEGGAVAGQQDDGIPNPAAPAAAVAAAVAIAAADAAVADAMAAWSEGSSASDIDVAGPGSGADIFQAQGAL